MENVFFVILFAGGLISVIGAGILATLNTVRKRKYGRIAPSVFIEKYGEKVYRLFSGNKYFIKFCDEVAYKISVFNTVSYEKNRQISIFVVLFFIFIISVVSIVLLFLFLPYWYIAFVYIVFFVTALIFLLQLVSDAIMNRYLKNLPEAIKILQSRFMTKGSISKAIQVSIPDLPTGIKAEMIRIYDAMKQNETERTKEVFWEIDKKYSNEHMSVLLDLIRLAHYNGGTETVKTQFDAMIKDVLEDLENQQDLRGASMSYIVMSVLFTAALPIVKIYNGSILGTSEMEYYSSREGMLFAMAYVGFLILLIGIMFYLKKKG